MCASLTYEPVVAVKLFRQKVLELESELMLSSSIAPLPEISVVFRIVFEPDLTTNIAKYEFENTVELAIKLLSAVDEKSRPESVLELEMEFAIVLKLAPLTRIPTPELDVPELFRTVLLLALLMTMPFPESDTPIDDVSVL